MMMELEVVCNQQLNQIFFEVPKLLHCRRESHCQFQQVVPIEVVTKVLGQATIFLLQCLDIQLHIV